jgi:hypothetical protein
VQPRSQNGLQGGVVKVSVLGAPHLEVNGGHILVNDGGEASASASVLEERVFSGGRRSLRLLLLLLLLLLLVVVVLLLLLLKLLVLLLLKLLLRLLRLLRLLLRLLKASEVHGVCALKSSVHVKSRGAATDS